MSWNQPHSPTVSIPSTFQQHTHTQHTEAPTILSQTASQELVLFLSLLPHLLQDPSLQTRLRNVLYQYGLGRFSAKDFDGAIMFFSAALNVCQVSGAGTTAAACAHHHHCGSLLGRLRLLWGRQCLVRVWQSACFGSKLILQLATVIRNTYAILALNGGKRVMFWVG